jgi:hypothetical protein
MLLKVYTAVIEGRWAVKVAFSLKNRHNLIYQPIWPVLSNAADALRELGIPPLAWADFSCDAWVQYQLGGNARANRHPRIGWLWSERRIREQTNWFTDVGVNYRRSKVVFGRSAKQLLDRWNAMAADLRRGMSEGEALALHFPGHLFTKLLRRAQDEGERAQHEINERRRAGTWTGIL